MRHLNTFIAQVVASSVTVILTVVAARQLAPDDLGVLAIAMAMQALGQGLVRSFGAEPLLYSHKAYGLGLAQLVSPSSTTALCGGLALGTVALGVYSALGQPVLGLALAAVFIATFVQDHLRTVLMIQTRGVAVLASDAVGLVTLVGGLLIAARTPNVSAFLLAWAASALAAASVGAWVVRPKLAASGVPAWLRENRRDGGLFTLDFAVTSGLNQASVLIVALIVGTAGAAALRGAQVLITPVSLVIRAGGAALTPIIVRAAAGSQLSRAYKLGAAFSAACVVAGALCVSWLILPREWVELLLGDSAGLALAVVIPSALALAATGVAIGAGLCLRATGRLAVATRLKLATAPLSATGIVVGALTLGAAGAQSGIAIGEGVRGALAWRRALQGRRP